jgi:hypothetical protein
MAGKWTSGDMRDAIGAARAEADRRNLKILLVDARGISLPQDELTRFLAGVRWADLFDQSFRAAFLVMPALYNGFAETVARNRGANVKAFFDSGPARAWLADKGSRDRRAS